MECVIKSASFEGFGRGFGRRNGRVLISQNFKPKIKKVPPLFCSLYLPVPKSAIRFKVDREKNELLDERVARSVAAYMHGSEYPKQATPRPRA